MNGELAPSSSDRHTPGIRAWRVFLDRLAAGLDRPAVRAEILASGSLSGRFLMMTILSSGIATLGLLLSSPAVVIGAMLLSPFMGPIILLGFAFRMVDWSAVRSAVASLAAGLGAALLVAILLTWVSPLKEPTAEILARARPNLFDLLVAVLSGIAGGYAVIRQRGETAIGVAIATALMPPIATVGFGLGSGNLGIAGGALLLFATNLIAIALAAAGMAAIYGFRPHLARHGVLGQALVVLMAAALCVPLTISLNTIALEGRATVASRAALHAIFGPKARVTMLTVRKVGRALRVEALVATPKYVTGSSAQLGARLKPFNRPTDVHVDQVVLADPSRLEDDRSAAASTADLPRDKTKTLQDMIPFPDAKVTYNFDSGSGVVLLDRQDGLDLQAAYALERALRTHSGFENTVVVPPLSPLPDVDVEMAKGAPPSFTPQLALIAWALDRWRVGSIPVGLCGLSVRGAEADGVLEALRTALGPDKVGDVTKGESCVKGLRELQFSLDGGESSNPSLRSKTDRSGAVPTGSRSKSPPAPRTSAKRPAGSS